MPESKPHSVADDFATIRKWLYEEDWAIRTTIEEALQRIEEQLGTRQVALDEVFRLIWIEDAPYVKDGPRKLDEWAERNQALATPYEERARAAESNPASTPKEDA